VIVSNEIMELLRKHADRFEQWGIDEAFLDVTSRVKDYASAEVLARAIKDEIYAKEKLTCSVGIASNKLVAKMASDFNKPNGLTVVKEEDSEKFLAPLPVRKLLWVGRKTGQKLESMGVKTIGDIVHLDPSVLTDTFVEMGKQLYLVARGIDTSEVQERSSVKSISREVTFQEDLSDFETVLKTLEEISDEVCKDAWKQHLNFRTVTIKIRYASFETHTRCRTLPFITSHVEDARKVAEKLLKPYLIQGRKIRLVGIKISNLTSNKTQRTLA
jgi:DNA polymerase IV (DinB-like DNA polymerase)